MCTESRFSHMSGDWEIWGEEGQDLETAELDSVSHSQASVAVILQIEDVAGFVAALLHDTSLHHHLHLVLEGKDRKSVV